MSGKISLFVGKVRQWLDMDGGEGRKSKWENRQNFGYNS
jgi:hypothetical protein